ncbi:3-oxo-tetronate kinase [Georgenia sp. AZ-5]|uniref:3-oxo-tetronate kinase n=1 Tax=Georgenia sp. AZ-5 TaxID=3367526 RepID=UPI003755040C
MAETSVRTRSPLGIVADDYTGAIDVGSVLRELGHAVELYFGPPRGKTPPPSVDVLVVALKSRSAEAAVAVRQSLEAARWLREQGAAQLYLKYSSTFDSTDVGNIGPVMDTVTEHLRADGVAGDHPVLVCPAVPAYDRTVYQGYLFVGDRLMSEASEGRHPLTPKRDANVVRLLGRQSGRRVGLLPWQHVSRGTEAAARALRALHEQGVDYVVADALDVSELDTLGALARGHDLVTGAAGLAAGLMGAVDHPDVPAAAPDGDLVGVVLSGSCTEATQEQVRRFEHHRPAFHFLPTMVADGRAVVAEALEFARANLPSGPVAISATAPPYIVRQQQEALGRERAARLVEDALADVAAGLVGFGVRKLVVAGGETSGAVVERCGISRVTIGKSVSPGVAWVRAEEPQPVWLLLKSGPLGDRDLFTRVLVDAAGRA